MINPLAEGSDRLVAGVARELGIGLIVPLPMAQAEYEKNFSSAEAVEVFRSMLNKAKLLCLSDDSDSSGIPGSSAKREYRYARMGIFISNHSQILLALWDGKKQGATGGTAGYSSRSRAVISWSTSSVLV